MKQIDTSTFSFEKLIGEKKLYVDKTALLYQLITGSSEYFCSRPRRFGKSLTLSTLEAIFQGRRDLFKGLAIDSMDYDWKVYPIIHIDFGDCDSSNAQMLEEWLDGVVQDHASKYHAKVPSVGTAANRFSRLISVLGKDTQVVVLVDEYEKVISDHIYSSEVEGMREVLGDFYQVIKSKEPVIRFAFVTGVTKYAKMSIFSRLNNLRNITMHPRYATLFGYTQEELEKNFADYIDKGVVATGMGKDTYLATLKRQYDGYCFCDGCETVYNPVSTGNFFDDGGSRFINYWIDTGGNMQLVMDVAKKVGFDLGHDLETPVDRSFLGTFDILSLRSMKMSTMELMALLEQSGYLTIAPRTPVGSQLIWLDFPNEEVRSAFTTRLLAQQGLGTETELSLLR
ncbi:MAG: AAA family ATPase [Sphaerochaetaceae bacterium]|nr:AAA family ATPase [Spirochaetales bacterium]MDY5500389.1 AAA family ATPase [Sphaerochaetaceae bacterium]